MILAQDTHINGVPPRFLRAGIGQKKERPVLFDVVTLGRQNVLEADVVRFMTGTYCVLQHSYSYEDRFCF